MILQIIYTISAAVLLIPLTFHVREWWSRCRFSKRHGCQPLSRLKTLDPVFGLDHLLEIKEAAANHRVLECWHKRHFVEYGHTFQMNLVGNDIIMTREPENIQAILATKFHDFEIGERRRIISKKFAGVGFLNADGHVWQLARALARPGFMKSQINLDMFEKHLNVWFCSLPNSSSPVDFQQWAFRYTLDVASDFLFGSSPGILSAGATETARKFAWAFDVGTEGIAQRIRLGKLAWLYRNSEENEACQIVHDYIDAMVSVAVAARSTCPQEHEGDGGSFLHALVNTGMTQEEIRFQMLSLLLGGRDTTACLMSAAMWEISRRPNVQARLRQEMSKISGMRPSIKDLKEMTYLTWVLRETLRLYPPVPMNSRRAARDTCLPRGGGPDGSHPIFVRKGQEVMYQVWSMHRRTDLWGEDADDFNPDRWATARQHFNFLPFNAGPRICLGQQFAYAEAGYVLVRFLQEYSRIEGVDTQQPWTEKLGLTCCILQGVQVKLLRA
ncbi:uncharacterized protein UV8b_05646 [Ustilaginoidea virens]|uniref:Uncharacterized protein n=1 Tax=Ustilaginoidea virens TaxID=1159556 RepID=A0A063C9T4_USTVR|nr:uncharacterized protein UV8b_05646 [Ustilaginoidea virens]QUC21403.1 hypothetical protein UV8b_05646 [Ustilaginoidea virens]GAO16328.1 hypothetical protein UVI_02017140 [Ustilaginoidea virens]